MVLGLSTKQTQFLEAYAQKETYTEGMRVLMCESYD